VDRLREILGREDFIYVADSKLCTRTNLAHVASYGGKFVTVLPRTRKEDKQFRETLRAGGQVRWRKLLVMENKRRKSDPPDRYDTTAEGPQRTSEGYRLLWFRSSQKEAIDVRARAATLMKAESELFDLNTRLNRGKLKQRSIIQKEIKKILRRNECLSFFKVNIAKRTHLRTKRLRRGRPVKNDPVKEVRIPVYYLEVQKDKEALRSESRTDGVFPLVTNLEVKQTPKKEVLLIYKYQPYVEKRHALLKTELEIAPVYIKKPRRAAGLVHATFMAMIVDALIERAVRLGMRREGIESLPILPEGRYTKTPTTARILEMFSDVSWFEFERGDEIVTFPVQLTTLQKLLLRLLDMDPSFYA
jgi:transposase